MAGPVGAQGFRREQSLPVLSGQLVGNCPGSAKMIVARASFREMSLYDARVIPLAGGRKRDHPARTDHNVPSQPGWRTKRGARVAEIGQLFLANEQANRGTLEPIFLADLVFEKAEVAGGDIVRVTDK